MCRSILRSGYKQQAAQLSQRNLAAGRVSFGRKVEDYKWDTIFYGHYRSIFNHCDVICHQSNRIR